MLQCGANTIAPGITACGGREKCRNRVTKLATPRAAGNARSDAGFARNTLPRNTEGNRREKRELDSTAGCAR